MYWGKEPGTKGCGLYDPQNNSLQVSRDIVFEENKSWPWEQESENSSAQNSFVIIEGNLTEESNDDFEPTTPVNNGSNVDTPVQTRISDSNQLSEEESEPRRYRRLGDICNDTEEVELHDELILMGVDEPVCYSQAIKAKLWEQVMKTEIEAIERNGTWNLVELPARHKAIGLKWVYKLKRDTDEKIIKYKAHIVAKDYVQKQGVDYEEVFAPVTRLETVRLLLALAAKNSWEVHHLDVKSVFLNGELSEHVYVSQPEGFVKEGKEHLVYKLVKALYGLRQAPRAWYAKLNYCLEKLGFIKCPYDQLCTLSEMGMKSWWLEFMLTIY